MEQQKKQHSVTVDSLLLKTQNLEAALKNERLVIVEEKLVHLYTSVLKRPFYCYNCNSNQSFLESFSCRRKLAQLQHAYTCLFQDYDNRLKSEKQANHRVGNCFLAVYEGLTCNSHFYASKTKHQDLKTITFVCVVSMLLCLRLCTNANGKCARGVSIAERRGGYTC